MLLLFLGDKLHITFDYANPSGVLSCFILRFIELDNPVFTLKDFDLKIGCKKAYIEPRFNKAITQQTIILECTLKKAFFLNAEEKLKENSQLRAVFKGSQEALLGILRGYLFDVINTELVVYGDTVRFPSFEAYSKNLKLFASGSIKEAGDVKISMKIFFSPRLASRFPEKVISMLTSESNGWLSYSLRAESGKDNSFLNLESDRFNLKFKEIKVR